MNTTRFLRDSRSIFRRSIVSERDGRSNLLYAVLIVIALGLLAPYLGIGAALRGVQTPEETHVTARPHIEDPARTDEMPDSASERSRPSAARSPASGENSLTEIENLLGDKDSSGQ